MIEISPVENSILEFDIDISGTQEVPKPRLVINLDENVSIFFKGIIENDKVLVDISKLYEIVQTKEFDAFLEVIVEDQYFIPWKEEIQIKEILEVKTEVVNIISNTKKNKILVESVNTPVKKKTKTKILKTAKDLFEAV